jgi:hypothetical protein
MIKSSTAIGTAEDTTSVELEDKLVSLDTY